MARHLIQNATTGDARIVGDAALAFFPGYAVVDTYDDGIPPAVFYGAGESDLRYVNVTELSDPASAASVALRAAFGSAPRGVHTRDYGMVLGVLRNAGAGSGHWKAINDSGHRPHFIDSVTTDADKIMVNYASLGAAGMTGTLLAVPDETLAQNGYFVGASVTPTSCELRLSQSMRSVSDYVSYNGSAWVSQDGLFTCSFAAGVLTLTHPSITLEQAARYAVSVTPRGGATASYSARVSSAGNALDVGNIKVEFRDAAGALVTTPDANMRAYVTHGGGQRIVDPRTVDTTAYPLSNIWLFGVHEMTAATA